MEGYMRDSKDKVDRWELQLNQMTRGELDQDYFKLKSKVAALRQRMKKKNETQSAEGNHLFVN